MSQRRLPLSNTEKLRNANSSAAYELEHGTTWAAFGQPERAYNQTLGALKGRTITELVQSFQTPDHEPVVIDLMSNTGFLEDLSGRVAIRGLAVGLTDRRSPAEKRRDTLAHLALQRSNILARHPTWEGSVPQGKRKYVDGIRDWLDKQGAVGADVVVCRPGGPLHFLTNSPEVLFGLLDRGYRILRPDGGILVTNVPKPEPPEALTETLRQLGVPERRGIERVNVADIQHWAETINTSGLGIEVTYDHRGSSMATFDSLMITRSEGSPFRLPTMEDVHPLREG